MLADLLMTIDAVLLGAVLATDREAWAFLGVVAQFLAKDVRVQFAVVDGAAPGGGEGGVA